MEIIKWTWLLVEHVKLDILTTLCLLKRDILCKVYWITQRKTNLSETTHRTMIVYSKKRWIKNIRPLKLVYCYPRQQFLCLSQYVYSNCAVNFTLIFKIRIMKIWPTAEGLKQQRKACLMQHTHWDMCWLLSLLLTLLILASIGVWATKMQWRYIESMPNIW